MAHLAPTGRAPKQSTLSLQEVKRKTSPRPPSKMLRLKITPTTPKLFYQVFLLQVAHEWELLLNLTEEGDLTDIRANLLEATNNHLNVSLRYRSVCRILKHDACSCIWYCKNWSIWLTEAKGQVVTYLLYINLNIFLEIISIQIQHQVVDKVKAVTHNDERQLVSEFSFLEREEL